MALATQKHSSSPLSLEKSGVGRPPARTEAHDLITFIEEKNLDKLAVADKPGQALLKSKVLTYLSSLDPKGAKTFCQAFRILDKSSLARDGLAAGEEVKIRGSHESMARLLGLVGFQEFGSKEFKKESWAKMTVAQAVSRMKIYVYADKAVKEYAKGLAASGPGIDAYTFQEAIIGGLKKLDITPEKLVMNVDPKLVQAELLGKAKATISFEHKEKLQPYVTVSGRMR